MPAGTIPFAIICTILLSLVTNRIVFRYYRIQKSAPVVIAMASIGVMFVINAIINLIFGFLSGMKEAPEIVEMAVRHITRHGDGRDYHGNDKGNARKVYEKMWKEIEPEYEALLKKGKVLSIKDDKGNTIKAMKGGKALTNDNVEIIADEF